MTCQRHEVVVTFTVAESLSNTTQGKTRGKFSSACHYKLCRPFSRTYVIFPVETHRSCTTFQQVILGKSPMPVFWQDLRANIQGNNPESQPSKGYLALGTPKNFLSAPKPFHPHLCSSAGQFGRFLTQLHLSSPKLQSPGSSVCRPVSCPKRRSLPD